MDKPRFYKELIANNKRRAPWHDYYSRCMYMVTVNKAMGAPAFGRLCGGAIALSSCGEIIEAEIKATPTYNPQLRILEMVVMPDHLHFLVFVTEPTKKHLGDIVKAIKSAATSKIRKHTGQPDLTVFEDGFHDRIIMHAGQRESVANYIRQNPHRLAIRKVHPDFFRRINTLNVGGKNYQAYGNIHLLDNPFREQVVVHRADSEHTKARKHERWLYAAANAGVLVSPFISPAEKAIQAQACDEGGRFVLIVPEPFPEKYKPTGKNFALCEEGRLLIVSAGIDEKTLSRSSCLKMNTLAAELTLPLSAKLG